MPTILELLAAPKVDASYVRAAHVTAELLEQTEQIGLRELHTLAASLQRRKSDKHAMLGRALAKAVRGETFAPEGQRNGLSFQLAGEIVEAFPFLDPGSVCALFAAALSLQGEPTLEGFYRQLEYHQGRKQGKADTLRTLEGTLLGPGAPAPPAPPALAIVPGLADAEPQRNPKDTIVFADGIYYIRHPEGDTYPLALGSEKELRLELINQFGAGNTVLNLIDSAGRMYPTENIMQWYGCNATGGIEKSFSIIGTRFAFSTARLSIGHRMPECEAEYDLAVDEWLKQMAGGTDQNLAELYDWLASTDQRYIHRPAAALAIIAPKDSGKSIFARAIAQTWGSPPIKLTNAVQQFNGSLQTNPVWHADEEMPKELTGHEFRDMVQSRDRLIEPKGREKYILLGAPRLIATVNELADIKIRGANGPDAVAAIADRLSVFFPSPRTAEALRGLQKPGSYDVDLRKMISHVRFIQLNFDPREQRFLGARSDRGAAEIPILATAAERAPQLFELLEQYLSEPNEFERTYHIEARAFSAGGQQFPVVTQEGGLYVRTGELSSRLNLPQWQLEQALQPFREGKDRPELTFGNRRFRARFWQLNIDRLLSAIGADVARAIDTLAKDTRERNPQFA